MYVVYIKKKEHSSDFGNLIFFLNGRSIVLM